MKQLWRLPTQFQQSPVCCQRHLPVCQQHPDCSEWHFEYSPPKTSIRVRRISRDPDSDSTRPTRIFETEYSNVRHQGLITGFGNCQPRKWSVAIQTSASPL